MSRVVKKPEVRWQEIVSIARDLFLEKGYERTTLQDVMKKAGIAKGTVYHYFDSKEALLEAVVENIVDEYIAKLRTVLDEKKGNALDRMKALFMASNVSHEQGGMIERLHQAGNIGLHARLLALTLTKMGPLYADVIQQGCEEGVFKNENPLETAEILLAGVQFMTDSGFYPWKKEDLLRRSNAIPVLVEVQLGAAEGSFSFLKPEILSE